MPKTRTNKTATDWWPNEAREICALAALQEDTARGFTISGDAGEKLEIIIWHNGGTDGAPNDFLRGFVNKCPHLGLPLETFPDKFLNALGDALICSAHGAQFDFDGACFAGPCQGQNLTRIDLQIDGDRIMLPAAKD